MLAERQRRFTAEEYHAMASAGIFAEDDRIELIDGYILDMAPTGGPHIGCVIRLSHLFFSQVASFAQVSVQNPVRLGTASEPEPDIALLCTPRDESRVPSVEEVILVVEVSDTTLDYDQSVKLPRYAAAGIPEVWIVALQRDYIEVCRKPKETEYLERRRMHRGKHLSIEALPDAGLFAVDVILGLQG